MNNWDVLRRSSNEDLAFRFFSLCHVLRWIHQCHNRTVCTYWDQCLSFSLTHRKKYRSYLLSVSSLLHLENTYQYAGRIFVSTILALVSRLLVRFEIIFQSWSTLKHLNQCSIYIRCNRVSMINRSYNAAIAFFFHPFWGPVFGKIQFGK